MEFSQEEIKEINKILVEVDKEQENNGNILYLFDEVAEKILDRIKKEENHKLQNIYY